MRKYGVATATGTHIGIPMVKAGVRDFATGSDWTPAAGDVKVSIDGGAQANITTLPTYSNGDWIFQLSAAELTGKRVAVRIVDSATKAVDDNGFNIETYGHASALHPFDLGTAMSAQAVGSVTTVNDKTGYSVSTVTDKTGYTVSTVTDKSGYSISGTLTTLDALSTHGDTTWASMPTANSGTAQSGGPSTIQLATGASTVDDYYVGQSVYLTGDPGKGQDRVIVDYVGSSRLATVDAPWGTQPTSATTYNVMPARVHVGQMNSDIITTIRAGLSTFNPATDDVNLSSAAIDAILDAPITELAGIFTFPTTLRKVSSLQAMLARNKITQDGSTFSLYADDGTTVVMTWNVSDNGTVFTSEEAA